MVDTVPFSLNFGDYIGSYDSFVFSLKPEMKGYPAEIGSDYIMLCQPDYLNIGAQGEGPAINLDATFTRCNSHKSKTFNNEILTGRSKGRFVNRFEVEEIELFII